MAEHSDLRKLNLSAVGTHLTKCQACHQCDNLIGNFTILKQCRNNFETQVYEALQFVNKQLGKYQGTMFLLKVFN